MDENPRTSVPQKCLLAPEDAMRCSADERERTAGAIVAAASDGRLTVEEAEGRLTRAYGARYRHELDALMADLPAPAILHGVADEGHPEFPIGRY